MRELMHNRPLLTIGLAESVSGVGSWITMMAVFALLVFRGDGSLGASSAIFLAALGPLLVCGPLAGWLCDRVDRRALMVASELASAVLVAGLIIAHEPTLIYTLLALQSVCVAVMAPARQSAVPDLVPRESLTQANALLQQAAGAVKIGAPVLAGLVLAVLTPQQAMALDVLSFLLSALILARLPALPPRRGAARGAAAPQPSLLAALRAAPGLRLLFVLTFTVTLIIMGFDVISSVFVRDVLRSDERFFGLSIGLVGLGTVGASAWLLLRRGPPRHWRDVLLGVLLLGALPAGLGLATLLPVSAARALVLAVCLLGGVGNGLLIVQSGTLLQLLAPPELLGQASGALQSSAVAGQLITLLALPLLVPAPLPVGPYFGLATAAVLALALGVALTSAALAPPDEERQAAAAGL